VVLGASSGFNGMFGTAKCPIEECGSLANIGTWVESKQVERQVTKYKKETVNVGGWDRTCQQCGHKWFQEADE